jgi:hypothetical protein
MAWLSADAAAPPDIRLEFDLAEREPRLVAHSRRRSARKRRLWARSARGGNGLDLDHAFDIASCIQSITDRCTGTLSVAGTAQITKVTLRMLWDKRRHRYLALADYEAIGQGGRGSTSRSHCARTPR